MTIDPSVWLISIVCVSWVVLIAWIVALYVWSWRDDRGHL